MKAFNFTGNGWEYFRIWIVNILLTVITFGLYYPWAKVRNYRYFYANSQFSDASFDYHATGKQLFIGYLIALVLFFIYQLLNRLVPMASIPMLVIFFLAIPWIIWRSTKFGMRMTSYANVRFSFEGELSQSYINFFVYPIIAILTFAVPFIIFSMSNSALFGSTSAVILWPITLYMYGFIKQKNNSYLINGSRYGQGEFKTQLDTRTFMMIMLKTMGIALAGVVVLMLFIILILFIYNVPLDINASNIVNFYTRVVKVIILPIYPLLLVFYVFIIAYLIVKEREYVYANTILDKKISFSSTLKVKNLAWVMISNFLIVIFTLGFGFPWTKVRMARLMLEHTLIDAPQGFDAYIEQQQEKSSALADQIGDVFDIETDIAF